MRNATTGEPNDFPWKALLEQSGFLRSIALVKNPPARGAVRGLTAGEIASLEKQHNFCRDWSRLKTVPGFRPDFIRGNTFIGDCLLGVFSGAPREAAPGVMVPSGVYESTIVECDLGDDCLVKDCGLVARYVIGPGAVVTDVGALTAAPGNTFGNGVVVAVGAETGGREVVACAEMDVELAARVALRRGDRKFQKDYAGFAARYRERAVCDVGIVESGAVICRTTRVSNAFVGAGARIDGATLVENVTVLSSPEERTEISHGAVVRNSCLQWGCRVTTLAIVADSILTEHSCVERHGKVTASIIGPNTAVAEGEVTSCLLGPFIGFHHQSLLIAALWPEGKGNVGYGANVGSNHTSRVPDQEIFCGEGVFFGLGTNIKYPADYSGSPYSIIATGVDTLPQKVLFPFSLIAAPSRSFPDISPAYNQLSPAWVLSDNIYMVRRNEGKYKKRNQAQRTAFDFTVFRPEIVDLMVASRGRLRDVKEKKTAYTDRDVPGLGKNYLTEEGRRNGMDAYGFYIEYYCLTGLRDTARELLSAQDQAGIKAIYTRKTDSNRWEHQRALLHSEGWTERPLKENLERLIAIVEKIAEDTFRAKAKDDERGARIIDDYATVGVQAVDDGFIRSTRADTAAAVKEIRELIAVLP
jgi:hypothetical protein